MKTRAKVCGNKQRHATKEAAMAQFRSMRREGSIALQVYLCKFCKHYHVGHNRIPGRRR